MYKYWQLDSCVSLIYFRNGNTNATILHGPNKLPDAIKFAITGKNRMLKERHKYIVFQMLIREYERCGIIINVTCKKGRMQSIFISNEYKNVKIQQTLVYLPLTLCQDIWCHVCIDIDEILEKCWSIEQQYVYSIELFGFFSVRRIYSISHKLMQGNDKSMLSTLDYYEQYIPGNMRMDSDVHQQFVVIDMNKENQAPIEFGSKFIEASNEPLALLEALEDGDKSDQMEHPGMANFRKRKHDVAKAVDSLEDILKKMNLNFHDDSSDDEQKQIKRNKVSES